MNLVEALIDGGVHKNVAHQYVSACDKNDISHNDGLAWFLGNDTDDNGVFLKLVEHLGGENAYFEAAGSYDLFTVFYFNYC